jgi:hypothetical protein
MLAKAKGDFIVTPEKSDEMARPKSKTAGATTGPVRENDEDPLPEDALPKTLPASSGIAVGTAPAPKSYGRRDGVERQIPGPDGVTKRVRVVGPKL